MSQRISIPAKLALAAAPLVLAVGGLLTSTVSSTLDEADVQNHAADVVRVWNVAINLMDGVKTEEYLYTGAAIGDVAGTRAQTDQARTSLQDAIERIGAPGQLEAARRAFTTKLLETRVNADNADPDAKSKARIGYAETIATIDEITSLLPPEVGDRGVGQTLQALESNSRMILNLETLHRYVVDARQTGVFESALASAAVYDVYTNIDRFKAGATSRMIEQWTAGDFENKVAAVLADILVLGDTDPAQMQAAATAMDLARFEQTLTEVGAQRAQYVTEEASAVNDKAVTTEQSVIFKLAVPIVLCVAAMVLAYRMAQSITRRIRMVTDQAIEVSEVELPKLVTALSDPTGKAPLPEVVPIEGAGNDEVGDLAESFTNVQTTLVAVATEQMNVLRRGVSDIFVTLARRNRSLVDSQLNLLDRLEAEVEDPKTLADYYKIDHLATRMRRNTESLLVLANSDSRRRSSAALGIDDVVRASISEVEDYRRIEVLPMEALAVKGPVVADISHMLAELLDNATTFSSPTSVVRVAGHFATDGYLITVSDQGVGMAPERMEALNTLLENPPIIGLSVEPTLGLSVVSLLARKHGITVNLAPLSQGLVANVTIPAELYDRRATFDNDANYVADAASNALITLDTLFGHGTTATGPAAAVPPPPPPPPSLPPSLPPVLPTAFPAPVGEDATADPFGHAEHAPQAPVMPEPVMTEPVMPEPVMPHLDPLPPMPPMPEPVGYEEVTLHSPPPPPPPPLPPPPTSGDWAPYAVAADLDTSAGADMLVLEHASHEAASPVPPPPPPAVAEVFQIAPPTVPVLPRRSRVKGEQAAGQAPSLSPDQLVVLQAAAAPQYEEATEVDDEPAPTRATHKLSAAGLPIRIPGRSKPKTGDDDRTSGSTQPTRVRASLSAYTRGAAAAKGTHGFSHSGIEHFGPTDPSQGSK